MDNKVDFILYSLSILIGLSAGLPYGIEGAMLGILSANIAVIPVIVTIESKLLKISVVKILREYRISFVMQACWVQ